MAYLKAYNFVSSDVICVRDRELIAHTVAVQIVNNQLSHLANIPDFIMHLL